MYTPPALFIARLLLTRCASRGHCDSRKALQLARETATSSAGGFETIPKRWYNFIVLTRRNGLSHAGGLETYSRSLCRLPFPFVETAWHPLARVASIALVGTKTASGEQRKARKTMNNRLYQTSKSS